MGSILLYYKYVDITYPEQIRKWQMHLCKALELTGRIIIAHEGINGTVGGTQEAIEQYIHIMRAHPLFNDIDFKHNEGSSAYFPRLRIVVKTEITHLGLDPRTVRAQDGGQHLTPSHVHALLQQHPKNLLIFDGRNAYESRIGKFTGAHTPEINHFRELPGYIDAHPDLFKDKEVLMYCTGGIRCERASAYLKSKNIAQAVYQLQGGIVRYTQEFPDGFFRGKNYVFDGRIAVKVTDDILATCTACHIPCDEYTNCINAVCNKQFIVCKQCIHILHNCCSSDCVSLVHSKQVTVRTKPKKINPSCSS